MWPAALFLKASICTRTILSLVTCFQAIEAKLIFPCNFPPFLQGLGLDWALFPPSLLRNWTRACLKSSTLLLSLGTSVGSSVVVARGCNLRLDLGLVDFCFLFHSSHMKSSRGLNNVSTRLHNHFSNSSRVDLPLRPSMCSYHLTLRFMGNRMVALLRYSGVWRMADWPIFTHQVVQAFT